MQHGQSIFLNWIYCFSKLLVDRWKAERLGNLYKNDRQFCTWEVEESWSVEGEPNLIYSKALLHDETFIRLFRLFDLRFLFCVLNKKILCLTSKLCKSRLVNSQKMMNKVKNILEENACCDAVIFYAVKYLEDFWKTPSLVMRWFFFWFIW